MNKLNAVKRFLITYKTFRFVSNISNNELLNQILSIKIQDKYKSIENFSNNIDKIFVKGLTHMIECNDTYNELFEIFIKTYISLEHICDETDIFFTELSTLLNKKVVPINEHLDELYKVNKSIEYYLDKKYL